MATPQTNGTATWISGARLGLYVGTIIAAIAASAGTLHWRMGRMETTVLTKTQAALLVAMHESRSHPNEAPINVGAVFDLGGTQ